MATTNIEYCEKCDCNYDSFFGECYCCNDNDDNYVTCPDSDCREIYIPKFHSGHCPYCEDRKMTDVESGLYKGDLNPLYKAIESGETDLYGNKATVDYRMSWGRTPLSIIIEYNNIESIKRLLKDGANPNCLDSSGYHSSFYTACQEGNVEVFKLLIEYGADVDLKHKGYKNSRTKSWKDYWGGSAQEKEHLIEFVDEFISRNIKG